MSLPLEVEKALGKFKSGVADLGKILNSRAPDGSGPNFAAAGVALAITEPIAKICYPYVSYNHQRLERSAYKKRRTDLRDPNGRTARQDFLKDIRADKAVAKLWKHHFSNKRYSQFSGLIWDCFRNGITHLQLSQKVTNTPHAQYDNSFLTGVTWIGQLEDLELPDGIAAAKTEHLNFKLEVVKKKERPVFMFSPHVYYFDLKEAVLNLEKDVKTNMALQRRVITGWEIFCRSYKLDFNSYRLPLRNKIDTEIKGL